jgi:hypothetical protein
LIGAVVVPISATGLGGDHLGMSVCRLDPGMAGPGDGADFSLSGSR